MFKSRISLEKCKWCLEQKVQDILLAVTNIGEEKLCRYCSGTFNDYQKNISSTNLEIEAIILVLENFQLFFNQEQFTLRTDCENIKKFFENKNSSKLSTKRWIKFQNSGF